MGCVELCCADAHDEVAECLWCVSSSAECGDCGHSWVVPAGDVFLFYELSEVALAGDGVGWSESCELYLLWVVDWFGGR